MSGSNEEQGVSWDILDESVTLAVAPKDEGGLRVRFADDDGELIWATECERDFWTSRTQKGEIENTVAQHVPQPKPEVKGELQRVWSELEENADEYEQALLNPSVEELIAHTERVEVHGGPETEIDVFVRARPHGGEPDTRKLTFSNDEWMRADGDRKTPPVAIKYNNMFYRPLDINWEQWRKDIRPAWVEMQEIITDDHQTTAERIAMSAVRSLIGRLDVHAERSRIVNDTWNGWWDDSSDETTIWVPSDTLVEILDENNRDGDYLGALSRAAQEEGFTSGGRKQTTIEGNPMNLYPFPAEVLGVQEVDVIGLETDDDDDGEGESSGDDGDDGGDGGDGSDEGDTPVTPTSPNTVDSTDGSGAATNDEAIEAVVETAADLGSDGTNVAESRLVAQTSQREDIPPDEVSARVEEGLLEGQLYRPDGEDTIAVRPGGGEPAGRDELPLENEGVPDP